MFSFSLIGADGSDDKLTPARHSALSGGEQSVSLHLPLFAAAHVMLDSADPHAPRLLALDEAFAGVDDTGRSELLSLCVQFDLDLFMTGFDLWITYAGVPGCAHYDLSHSVAEHTVAATLLVWSGGELLAEHDGRLTSEPGQRQHRGEARLLGASGVVVPFGFRLSNALEHPDQLPVLRWHGEFTPDTETLINRELTECRGNLYRVGSELERRMADALGARGIPNRAQRPGVPRPRPKIGRASCRERV